MTSPLLIGKDYEHSRAVKSEDRDILRLSCTMSEVLSAGKTEAKYGGIVEGDHG